MIEKRCLVPLLFAALLAGGCASTKQDRPVDAGGTNATKAVTLVAPHRLPFPTTRKAPLVARGSTSTPTVVSYKDYRDPLIWMNRGFFAFNDVTYRFLLIPIAKGYTWIVPDPVERCVANFFTNIKSPMYLVNHLLQWKPKAAGRDVARFGVNTTVGLLGLFDPASSWLEIKKDEVYFEDTLAHYGAGYGIYIVMPFFGPSDLRKGTSTIVDYFLNPVTYLVERPTSTYITGYDYFQDFAPLAEDYRTLRKQSDDPYIFFRNLYLQGVQRDADYENR